MQIILLIILLVCLKVDEENSTIKLKLNVSEKISQNKYKWLKNSDRSKLFLII